MCVFNIIWRYMLYKIINIVSISQPVHWPQEPIWAKKKSKNITHYLRQVSVASLPWYVSLNASRRLSGRSETVPSAAAPPRSWPWPWWNLGRRLARSRSNSISHWELSSSGRRTLFRPKRHSNDLAPVWRKRQEFKERFQFSQDLTFKLAEN